MDVRTFLLQLNIPPLSTRQQIVSGIIIIQKVLNR